MNISQLSAFHAVMTSSTLSEAAERLGRTQPAISAAIKALEDQLGMSLFERRGRKLIPSPEAQYLFNEADAILGRLSLVRRTMKSLGDGELGQLNVAAMPGPMAMLFPKFIAKHISNKTNIRTSLLARSSAQIAELARAQSIDFGFADLPADPDGGGLYHCDVIVADCFIALPKQHALRHKSHISIQEIATEPIGSLQSHHVHTRELQKTFQKSDLDFQPSVESQTFLPILQFVMAGQCIAVIDPLTAIHVQTSGELENRLHIRPMASPIRYRYAIISPAYRAISVIAADIRNSWSEYVWTQLDDAGANPERGTYDLTQNNTTRQNPDYGTV